MTAGRPASPCAAGDLSATLVTVLLTRGLFAVGVAALLAAFTASQIRLFLASSGGDAPWTRLFVGQLIWWALWALLLLPVTALSRRFDFERGPVRTVVLAHLALAGAVSILHIVARVALLPLAMGRWDLSFWNEFVFAFSTFFHWNVVLYLLVVAAEHALRYQKQFRERELETSRLQTDLARAELDALRLQLQPHFLFNALSSVAELVHEDADKAESMVLRLSELLRWTLAHEDDAEVTLEQELHFTERYLQIEKVRFEDRLRVVWDVAPDTTEARVPQFLLQPLVENAIRHGLQPLPQGGTLTIAAKRDHRSLELTVTDDGVGLSSQNENRGIGLDNARARLSRFYGVADSLSLESHSAGGTQTRVVIPFHRSRTAT